MSFQSQKEMEKDESGGPSLSSSTKKYNKNRHRHRLRSTSSTSTTTTTKTTTSFRSISFKYGVPTVVALKGGVRGGHSVVSSSSSHHTSHSQQPLGLSPTDYLSSTDGPDVDGNIRCMSPEHWPKGFVNVGNTCYANAALQCLLSTALTSALLDPKTVPILRRHSSNPNLLAMGSGSVDSSDDDDDDDDDDTIGSRSVYSVGPNSNNEADIEDEEDGIFLDSSGVPLHKSFSPTQQGMSKSALLTTKKFLREEKRLKRAMKRKKREARRTKMENAIKRKERERRRMEANCKWLTQELTSIATEYMEDSTTSIRQSLAAGGGGRNTPITNNNSKSSLMGWLSSSYNQTTGTGVQQPQNRYGVMNPGSITRHPNRLSQCLSPYQQEDAHEFMRALLSNLVMNGHNRTLSSLFDGLLESSVICQTCGRASLTRDRYMDLSVDINDPDISTLDDALFEFTKDELLTEDNAVFCQKCRQKRSVTKGLRLATAPSILVCHLKRFAFNDYGRLVRLHKRIEFPQRLEIGDYMSNLNKARPPPYDLVGLLVHQGQTCASGHYLSFVKKNGEWFKCNDSEITKVDESTVMMQQAYILMYEVAEMRAKAASFLPKPFRKDISNMSTIGSCDDATLSKGDFSVCGSYHSASDKSSSKRSVRSCRDSGKGSYNNPYGSVDKNKINTEESTTDSIMRVLRDVGVTRFISDICCETGGINEPETRVLNDTILFDKNTGTRSERKRNTNKYAHECESVDTQDSFIRRQSLMNATSVNVLEVQQKRKPRGTHRSQTAPRRRTDSIQETDFHMVAPFSTFTPRFDGGGGKRSNSGVIHRNFFSNENQHHNNNDAGSVYSRDSVSTKSTLRERERRERHSSATTRYSMSGHEEIVPPRNLAFPPGRPRSKTTTRSGNNNKSMQ